MSLTITLKCDVGLCTAEGRLRTKGDSVEFSKKVDQLRMSKMSPCELYSAIPTGVPRDCYRVSKLNRIRAAKVVSL